MNIIPIKQQHLEPLRELWNTEMPQSFHLRKDLFYSQIELSKDMNWESSFVALEDDKVVGGIIVKTWKREELEAYQNTAWLSLIHVSKKHQLQGIGTALFNKVLHQLKQENIKQIHLGKSMNNFFCGVPVVFQTNRFFEKIGFVEYDRPVDMHKHIIDKTLIPLRNKTAFNIRISTQADFKAIHNFFLKNFPGRWQLEFEEYVAAGHTGKEFAIIEKDNQVVAFCRINQPGVSMNMYNTNFTNDFTNLYGVGPLGVDKDMRDYSLGFDVTAYAINHAVAQGASDIIIDWTGLVSFYQKFGFEIWNKYVSMKYSLEVE